MNKLKFSVETRWGGSEAEPTIKRMQELIAELKVKDEEHPDMWLAHKESGWILRLDEDNVAYLEDPEGENVSHIKEASSDYALKLWSKFALGGPGSVSNEPWIKGYVPVSDLELQLRQQKARELSLAMDREFYDQLGPERPNTLCKSEGCSRGTIQYSVFCRSHHFENIRRCQCPFNH